MQTEFSTLLLTFNSVILCSFLYDFIVLFPELKELFYREEELYQILIDGYNVLGRGKNYIISPHLREQLG